MKSQYVYILHCADNTYYTGWTTDIQNRIKNHNTGKGARYTKNRRPVKLVHLEEFETKSQALKREYEIKQFTRKEKEELIQSGNHLL